MLLFRRRGRWDSPRVYRPARRAERRRIIQSWLLSVRTASRVAQCGSILSIADSCRDHCPEVRR